MEPLAKELVTSEDNVVFKPNEGPQTSFLSSPEQEVFYGGAKGGGKTYALLVDCLRYCQFKTHRALLLRRSIPDLKDIIFKAKTLYPKAFPGVRWSENDKTFYFPSGARIEMGYCETQSDLVRYQGQNYTWIGVDEICQFPFVQEMLNYLRANIRTTDPDNVPPMFRCTGNPGEVASEFMKKEFVEKSPEGVTFWQTVDVFDPRKKVKVRVRISKKFIKATVFDNPYLMQDNSYLATLASLPEVKRKQWLDGSWDVSEFSAFPEFDHNIHVVSSFPLPRDCKRVKGADWGHRQPGACYWGAVLPSGQLVIYREFVFQGKDGHRVAQEGRAMEMGEPKSLGVLDASAWNQKGTLGQSVGEAFQMNWPAWVPSSRARMANNSSRALRKNLVHQHLAIDPMTGNPRIVIFPQCRKLIEALAGIPVDKHDPEVVDTDSPLDHYYDALSYLLQGRPSQLRSWADPFLRTEVYEPPVVDQLFGY